MEKNVRYFLRCLINLDQRTDSPEALSSNYRDVDAKECVTALGVLNKTWADILQFVHEYHSQYFAPPPLQVLESTFNDHENLDALRELEAIKRDYEAGKFPLQTKTGFAFFRDKTLYECRKHRLGDLLQTALNVSNGRVKVGHQWLEGTDDALQLVYSEGRKIEAMIQGEPNYAALKDLMEEGLAKYQEAERDPYYGFGTLLGIKEIDASFKGLRRKELMVVAGATGECKTTLALNIAYNMMFYGGYNVFYASLEMGRDQVREKLDCIHLNNLGSDPHGNFSVPPQRVTYDDIRHARLSKDQKRWYEYAVSDIRTDGSIRGVSPPYGKFHLFFPVKNTLSEIRTELERASSEMGDSGFHLVIIDYPGLILPEQGTRLNQNDFLNQLYRELKILAMTFDRGKGVAMICPHQINREGKKSSSMKTKMFNNTSSIEPESKKAYETFHLANASETERSADFVIYTRLSDELRASKKLEIGCLKNRYGAPFDRFEADTDLETHRVYSLEERVDDAASAEEIEL